MCLEWDNLSFQNSIFQLLGMQKYCPLVNFFSIFSVEFTHTNSPHGPQNKSIGNSMGWLKNTKENCFVRLFQSEELVTLLGKVQFGLYVPLFWNLYVSPVVGSRSILFQFAALNSAILGSLWTLRKLFWIRIENIEILATFSIRYSVFLRRDDSTSVLQTLRKIP